jgi:hypothetical protein
MLAVQQRYEMLVSIKYAGRALEEAYPIPFVAGAPGWQFKSSLFQTEARAIERITVALLLINFDGHVYFDNVSCVYSTTPPPPTA